MKGNGFYILFYIVILLLLGGGELFNLITNFPIYRILNASNFAQKECSPMQVEDYGLLSSENKYIALCKNLDGGTELKLITRKN